MTLGISTGEETSVPPVSGFTGLNTLRRKAVLIYSVHEARDNERLTVLSSMNFSCNGNISRWTFVARRRDGVQYPRFQLWRRNGPDRYERIYESNTDSSRFMTEERILDSQSQNMSHLLLYHFKLVMYWECTNLAIMEVTIMEVTIVEVTMVEMTIVEVTMVEVTIVEVTIVEVTIVEVTIVEVTIVEVTGD